MAPAGEAGLPNWRKAPLVEDSTIGDLSPGWVACELRVGDVG